MSQELWKDIDGYPGYQVSSLGRVKNLKNNQLLTVKKNRDGYLRLGLYRDDKRYNLYVHRLVARAFCEGHQQGLIVNHIDGNKTNNNYTNLEWVTQSENIQHAYDTGLKHGSKLSGNPRKFVKINETGEVFESIRDCAKAINASHKDVCECILHKNNRETCHGLHFKEISENEYKHSKIKDDFLRPHQREAVNELASGKILNGGVGSGKSRTALYFYFKENGGRIEDGDYIPMDNPRDLYIITTAKKRDDMEWEAELVPFLLYGDYYNCKVVIDSWNNIQKYVGVNDAWFIFDEQKVSGSGAWVKAFLKIVKFNDWILLSATPADVWSDYIPVFVANGFYRNRTEFNREHVVYSQYVKFPKIDRYINTGKLIRHRNKLLIDMDFQRKTNPIHMDIYHKFDSETMKFMTKMRRDPYNDLKPFKTAAGLYYSMRRLVNSDVSRQKYLLELSQKHPRMIVFYNFDYERDILLGLDYGSDVEVAEWTGHKHQPIPNSERWIYLVNYNSGSEGFNCIKTDTIVFYSQNYSYRTMTQAAGRIDRMNTPYENLYYYHFKSRSGIDLAISKALAQKKNFNERKSKLVRWEEKMAA